MSMRSCPRTVSRVLLAVMGFFAVLAAFALPAAAAKVTSPKEQFGFAIGDDYRLVNYKQLTAYWKKLDTESDRMKLVEIGKTAEGRTMLMAIVTSPANHARLARIKDTARRLALAEGLTDAGARTLAAGGKAVVWIDGGLHATEILGSQQLVELVWRMVSRDDAETRRILDDVVLLAVPANPDGLDLVADWYMREKEPSKRSMNGVPVLYQKYIGHDNNRDFYMNTQAETKAMSRQLYIEWHPQILYNHHQTGPAGTVLFAPPFRDPFNYAFDPLIPVGLDLVSASMHNRFVTEDKPGATMRSGAGYSTWWNGGLRSTGYFHNVIGILTEAIGNPTPIDIPFIPERLLPKHDYPYPVAPQKWHFRQSVEYAITADMAILDVASKHREDFLYRRYLMGKHAIELGSKDSWTVVPGTIAEVRAAVERDSKSAGGPAAGASPGSGRPGRRIRPRPGSGQEVLRRHLRQGQARSARLHHPFRPGRFPDGGQVRQRPARERHRRRTGEGGFRGRGPEISQGLVRRPDRPGLSAARDDHVRAPGPPQRHPLSGRGPQSALRRGRLDAGLPDGHRLRPGPRRLRRAVRAGARRDQAAGGRFRRRGRARPVFSSTTVSTIRSSPSTASSRPARRSCG